jgi:hypothetical protein
MFQCIVYESDIQLVFDAQYIPVLPVLGLTISFYVHPKLLTNLFYSSLWNTFNCAAIFRASDRKGFEGEKREENQHFRAKKPAKRNVANRLPASEVSPLFAYQILGTLQLASLFPWLYTLRYRPF